jgi:hypothetical protein
MAGDISILPGEMWSEVAQHSSVSALQALSCSCQVLRQLIAQGPRSRGRTFLSLTQDSVLRSLISLPNGQHWVVAPHMDRHLVYLAYLADRPGTVLLIEDSWYDRLLQDARHWGLPGANIYKRSTLPWANLDTRYDTILVNVTRRLTRMQRAVLQDHPRVLYCAPCFPEFASRVCCYMLTPGMPRVSWWDMRVYFHLVPPNPLAWLGWLATLGRTVLLIQRGERHGDRGTPHPVRYLPVDSRTPWGKYRVVRAPESWPRGDQPALILCHSAHHCRPTAVDDIVFLHGTCWFRNEDEHQSYLAQFTTDARRPVRVHYLVANAEEQAAARASLLPARLLRRYRQRWGDPQLCVARYLPGASDTDTGMSLYTHHRRAMNWFSRQIHYYPPWSPEIVVDHRVQVPPANQSGLGVTL